MLMTRRMFLFCYLIDCLPEFSPKLINALKFKFLYVCFFCHLFSCLFALL